MDYIPMFPAACDKYCVYNVSPGMPPRSYYNKEILLFNKVI